MQPPVVRLLPLCSLLVACAPRFPSTGADVTVSPASLTPAAPSSPSAPATTTRAAPLVVASAAASAQPPPEAVHHDPAQVDPSLATAPAPDVFRARFDTTRGAFVVEVHRDWAPHGADRFYNLVKLGFYDDTRFFRVIDGFMAQFGISGDPAITSRWRTANIEDDPVKQSNTRGFVTFAQTSQPNSRSTQIFVNYGDNSRLDHSRFAPFGQVVEGMRVLDALYSGYGEGSPGGSGPDQMRIEENGNAYLDADFPKLDRVLSARVL
ncbi:MAG TPA: peptidylprolyl isomerase [Polyangiaceae bacterium]